MAEDYSENFYWQASTTPSPFAWAIVDTALHCRHRKEEKCTVDSEHLNPSGLCTYEVCPFKPAVIFEEVFTRGDHTEDIPTPG